MSPEAAPAPIPDRRITSPESRMGYKAFAELIKAGNFDEKQLYLARDQAVITPKQCDALVSLLIETLKRESNTSNLIDDVLNHKLLEFELNNAIDSLEASTEEPTQPQGKKSPEASSIMVMYLDINKMKFLNDTYGHSVGDEAIITVAKRLQSATKKTDRVFHLHGDEFAAILQINKSNPQTLAAISERIQNQINNDLSVEVGNKPISFQVSVGYKVINKGDKITAKEVVDEADKAMYDHKQGQRESL